ncbi:hypothetical protein [Cellvibrio polysaccharolyticus]|nr:hypothetical protein [Cellvibrio polysaccharolyticus]
MKAFAFVVIVLLLSMAGISHNIVMAKGQVDSASSAAQEMSSE